MRDALANAALRRLMVAYAGAAVSEWSVWLAVLVYAQDRSGSTAAGWMALALLIPLVIAAPFAGRAFARDDPERVLGAVFATQALMLAVAAVMAVIEAPLAVIAVPAAVAIGGVAFARPGQAVIAPGIVRTARELTSANLLTGYIDSGCVLVGPLVATACLAAGGAATALGVCGLFAVAGVVAMLRMPERPAAADPAAADPAAGTLEPPERPSLWRALRTLRGRDHIVVLLAALSLQHLLMGVMGLMFVVLAVDELGMGGSGAGILNIAFGIGAVTSGLASTVLAGRGRLAAVVVGSVVVMAVGTLAVGLFVTVPVVVVGLAVVGCGRSLLDVTARMLLQRSVPPQHLAATFAIIEVLTSVGLALGTVASQVMVATIGAPAGLVAVGTCLLVVLALIGPRVWLADRAADVPVVAVALLRSMPLFAPLPPASLEAVARAGVERTFEPGETLMREGDPGESYHAVAGGAVEVTVDGHHLRTLGRGVGVGEVALLAHSRRTATVTAIERTHTLEIDREPFLLAVTRHEPSLVAARRLMKDFGY